MLLRFVDRRLLCLAATLIAALGGAGTGRGAATTAPSFRPSNLLAEGSDERYWIGVVEPGAATGDPQFRTTFFGRDGGASAWQKLAQISGRARQLAHRGTQLAVLLESGDWVLIADDGSITDGPPLPQRQQLTSLAYSGETLWALGIVPPNLPAVPASPPTTGRSAPTTATAPATSPSTTAPAAGSASVFELVNGKWTDRGRIAAGMLPQDAAPVLTIAMGRPYVSSAIADRAIRLLSLRKAEEISDFVYPFPAPLTAFRLMAAPSSLVLWGAHADRGDDLRFISPEKSAPREASVSLKRQSLDRAATIALGRIRLLAMDSNGVEEQLCDVEDGHVLGPPALIAFTSEAPDSEFSRWFEYLVWALLLAAMISALRLRRTVRAMVFDLNKVQLASPGTRFSAGLIDAIPLLAGGLLLLLPRLSLRGGEIIASASVLLYLLHTTLAETMSGRSIGKHLLGLTVVAVDGHPPTTGALAVRNILRIVDVGLCFVPLIVIFFSPLRQRTGDVAAGTLVVVAKPGADPGST